MFWCSCSREWRAILAAEPRQDLGKALQHLLPSIMESAYISAGKKEGELTTMSFLQGYCSMCTLVAW